MGIFSSKKKIYVSSTVYKIIDDGTDRAPFIREVVAGTALSRNGEASYADNITQAIQQGPRATQRSFFRWCKTNFDFGMPRARVSFTHTIDMAVVSTYIIDTYYGGDTSWNISIGTAFIDNADESYYAEKWLRENRLELAELDWAADYDAATETIVIQYPTGTTYQGAPISSDTLSITNFNSSNKILVAYYTAQQGEDPSSSLTMLIYEMGSGTVSMDTMETITDTGESVREFYPFIPLRINNKSVFEHGSPAASRQSLIEKAWKKALGGVEIQDTISQIEENEDIDDIDYAYMVFGVCLNTTDKAEKDYIFKFFQGMATRQGTAAGSYNAYRAANDALGGHEKFYANVPLMNTTATSTLGNEGYISGVKTASSSVSLQTNEVHLTLPSEELGVLDMKVSWSDIVETRITGQIKPNAKTGDVIIRKGFEYREKVKFAGIALLNPVSGITILKQINNLEYIKLEIYGLSHKNLIYKGKSVDISAAEAMGDPEDSGFIIPLHEPTLKALGGIKATDVARESYLLVFNSYQVVKKKWYQKGIFGAILSIIVVVVVVVISVATAGSGTPAAAIAGAGILGSAASVGAALGFSGLLAVAVGAAANTIAAMLILQLVSIGTGELFGEKIGTILTAVAAVVMIMGTSPEGFNFSNINTNIANLAVIDKLVLMTDAATDIIGVVQQEKLDSILASTQKMTEEYTAEIQQIEDLWKSMNFGDQIIDPMLLTDFTNSSMKWPQIGPDFIQGSNFGETPQAFLDRTLMTAADLLDISNSAISEFVNATLALQ